MDDAADARTTAKRATRLEQIERERAAARILCAHAGRRLYELESLFLKRFPDVSRRQAARYLARAREDLATSLKQNIRDLASSLPSQISRGLRLAWAGGDIKAATGLLKLVADLAVSHEAPDDEGKPLERVEFVIVGKGDEARKLEEQLSVGDGMEA